MNENQLIKYITNELNDQEKQGVEEWVSRSEDNQKMFNQIQELWTISSEPEPDDYPNIDLQWTKLESSLEPEKTSYSLWYRISAVILLAIGLFFTSPFSGPYDELTVNRAETESIQLADNSTVEINSETTLKYFNSVDDTVRKVFLKGEAFFKVTKSKHPFIVETNEALITVLGTQFNIRSRDGKTSVYVTEGRVSVKSLNDKTKEVILTKGYETEVLEAHIPTDALFKEKAIAWLDRQIVFEHTNLDDVLNELERLYDVSIEIRGKANPNATLTATFERKFIVQDILQSICTSLNLKLGKDKDTYVVFK